jgi:hypothetical protein
MKRATILVFLLTLASAPAHGWDLATGAPPATLEAFHEHFALAAYPFPKHGAAPLGITGFDVWGDIAVSADFVDQDFAEVAIDGDLPGDLLAFYRVGARKGLPGGIDLGAAYTWVASYDLELVSVELQYALLDGGPLSPALSVRATGTRSIGGDEEYELSQYGIEVLASKGFTVLTPYLGAGIVRSEGRFPLSGDLDVSSTQEVLYAGVVLNLLVPKIALEIERGETWQAALRVGFGI